jgi:hypothetical protein
MPSQLCVMTDAIMLTPWFTALLQLHYNDLSVLTVFMQIYVLLACLLLHNLYWLPVPKKPPDLNIMLSLLASFSSHDSCIISTSGCGTHNCLADIFVHCSSYMRPLLLILHGSSPGGSLWALSLYVTMPC